MRHLKCACVGQKRHPRPIVSHLVQNCPDAPIFGSKRRERVILNGLDIFFYHGNEDWACGAWNTLALGQNTWLLICMIYEKINDSSGRSVMLVMTIVFLTPALLKIHPPVTLECVRLHLKDENYIKQNISFGWETAFGSRCNIYHAPFLPKLAFSLR